MKVLIDTNVIISAILKDKIPEKILLFVISNENIHWIVSSDILKEYEEILKRPKFKLPDALISKWCGMIQKFSHLIDVKDGYKFSRDQKDSIFINCALASNADFLISGDRDFENFQFKNNTKIISVSSFNALIIEGPLYSSH